MDKETGFDKTGQHFAGTSVNAIKRLIAKGDRCLGTRKTKAESCKSTKDDVFDSIE